AGVLLVAVLGALCGFWSPQRVVVAGSQGPPSPTSWEQLNQSSWPTVWLTVPLITWGLWCTLRRGWRELKKRRAPTPWMLTLYTAVVAIGLFAPLGENTAVASLSLGCLAVLLAVFGVADFFRGISERLILLPPAERQEEVAV